MSTPNVPPPSANPSHADVPHAGSHAGAHAGSHAGSHAQETTQFQNYAYEPSSVEFQPKQTKFADSDKNGVMTAGDPRKTVTTVQRPDGTLVTTTTSTVTKDYDEGGNYGLYYYDDTYNSVQVKYCCTIPGILRILEIIVGFIIVGCVTGPFGSGPYINELGGQTFVLVATCFCVCITFLFLILFFFGFHVTIFRDINWRICDLIYSIIAVIVFLVAMALEIYYSTTSWMPDCPWLVVGVFQHECSTVGAWVAAAVFCFINVILYALSAFFALDGAYYDQV